MNIFTTDRNVMFPLHSKSTVPYRLFCNTHSTPLHLVSSDVSREHFERCRTAHITPHHISLHHTAYQQAIFYDIQRTHHHHKHQGLDPLIRSVSTVTTAPANVSSVFQLFSFLVVCSGMILNCEILCKCRRQFHLYSSKHTVQIT
jgi:hypothetical protein